MDVVLRRAVPSDAPAVAQVYVTSWNVGFAGLMPRRVLHDAQIARWQRDLSAGLSRWWVAHTDAEIVGFAGTGPSRDPVDPRLGELDTIAVAPHAWRSGVGRRLMDAAVAGEVRDTGRQIAFRRAL